MELRMPESLEKLAESYFNYLAKSFPVMCASDEFHFIPRVAAASRYYDSIEDMDASSIEAHVSALKEFQRKFQQLASEERDLERLIDLELLNSSIAGILIEFDENRSWAHNPLLYLKIAFIGLDHALTKPAENQKELMERALARLCAIPRLLRQALQNLDLVPAGYQQASLAMLNDCESYMHETERRLSNEDVAQLSAAFERTRSALEVFRAYLLFHPTIPDREFAAPNLEMTLRGRFGSVRSIADIFQIAVEEWFESLRQLEEIQRSIMSSKTWLELYHEFSPEEADITDTITLYMREMKRLKGFFKSIEFGGIIGRGNPIVCQTPVYLQSVRGSASFSAAFTNDKREKDFFFITAQSQHIRGDESAELLRKRFHREYKFLTAHETFPGHYLLDSTRRDLGNPVRSQIESPLFYEGWAYYVESLLTEYGYADSHMDRLVDLKRRLWRSARCQIDVGLNTGRLLREDAQKLLRTAGFSDDEALRQMDRFRLSPGYQLCYSLGRFEISELKKTYGRQIGHDKFHGFLLQGGQLPFHLIEKRLSLAVSGSRP